MASASDLSDEILRAFDNLHKNEMTLNELHSILVNQNKRIATDELIRIIQSPSLFHLFNLQRTTSKSYLIQLSPKVRLYFNEKFYLNKFFIIFCIANSL